MEGARLPEKQYLIGAQLRIARENTGLSSTKFIELIDFDSEQQYRDMEANEVECPESVINKIYEATGILPDWLKDPTAKKYEVESAHQWLKSPRNTASRISQQAKDYIYVTIAVSIPAKDRFFWRGKNLWAKMTNDYLHVGVCVPIAEYRYQLFDTGLPADFGNEHDRDKYASSFFLFLQELFDRFDICCQGIILSDFKADKDLYDGKVYPRQVLSGPKVFERINWVQAMLEPANCRDKSYLVKNCGGWIEDMRKAFLEVSKVDR
ncbi:hypothetical protein TFLX_00105 [Thermoflexales bacterium]|nr:hypothetical protein TFLX_00105 [Thermoflexales bacterium]